MEAITQRIERIKTLSAECAQAKPPVPKSVKIELTARCDLQCAFCASHTRLRAKREMDQDFFKLTARQLRDLGVEQLGVFYLGESFLCDWLPDAIRYAKQDCGFPYVFLTTNGRLATPNRVLQCMLAGLDSLKFTLNFADNSQFREITGLADDDNEIIISNLKAARRLRDRVESAKAHRCGVYASSLRYDAAQEQRMQKLVAKILPYVDEHYFLPLYGPPGFPAAGRGGDVARKPLPCWSLFTEGHICSDGQLSACCFDHSSRFAMGDLNKMPFLEAWHSRPFQELRKAHLAHGVAGTACAECIAYQ
jgi:hypothetical protein